MIDWIAVKQAAQGPAGWQPTPGVAPTREQLLNNMDPARRRALEFRQQKMKDMAAGATKEYGKALWSDLKNPQAWRDAVESVGTQWNRAWHGRVPMGKMLYKGPISMFGKGVASVGEKAGWMTPQQAAQQKATWDWWLKPDLDKIEDVRKRYPYAERLENNSFYRPVGNLLEESIVAGGWNEAAKLAETERRLGIDLFNRYRKARADKALAARVPVKPDSMYIDQQPYGFDPNSNPNARTFHTSEGKTGNIASRNFVNYADRVKDYKAAPGETAREFIQRNLNDPLDGQWYRDLDNMYKAAGNPTTVGAKDIDGRFADYMRKFNTTEHPYNAHDYWYKPTTKQDLGLMAERADASLALSDLGKYRIQRKKEFIDAARQYIDNSNLPNFMKDPLRDSVKTTSSARHALERMRGIEQTVDKLPSIKGMRLQMMPPGSKTPEEVRRFNDAMDFVDYARKNRMNKLRYPVTGKTKTLPEVIAESGPGPNIYKGWDGMYGDVETALGRTSMSGKPAEPNTPRWWSTLEEVPMTGGSYTGRGGSFAVVKLPKNELVTRVLSAQTPHIGQAMSLEEASMVPSDVAPAWGRRFKDLSSSPNYEVAIPWKEMNQIIRQTPHKKMYKIMDIPKGLEKLPGRLYTDPSPEVLNGVKLREYVPDHTYDPKLIPYSPIDTGRGFIAPVVGGSAARTTVNK